MTLSCLNSLFASPFRTQRLPIFTTTNCSLTEHCPSCLAVCSSSPTISFVLQPLVRSRNSTMLRTMLPTPLLLFLSTALASEHLLVSPDATFNDFEYGVSMISDLNPFLMPRQSTGMSDLQTFTQALGGIQAPSIMNSGDPKRPFLVAADTFVCSICKMKRRAGTRWSD